MEEREVGRRMPGAVPGGGPLEGETLSGLPIGLTMVSGLRASSAPAWVPPRVPLWPVGALVFPRVAVASQGRAARSVGLAVPLVTGLAGRGWTSAGLQSRMRRLEAGRSSIVRASALPLAPWLPYEWRPLRPSIRGLTPESGLCLQAGQQQA